MSFGSCMHAFFQIACKHLCFDQTCNHVSDNSRSSSEMPIIQLWYAANRLSLVTQERDVGPRRKQSFTIYLTSCACCQGWRLEVVYRYPGLEPGQGLAYIGFETSLKGLSTLPTRPGGARAGRSLFKFLKMP